MGVRVAISGNGINPAKESIKALFVKNQIRGEVINEFVNKLKEVSFPLSNIRYDAGGEVVDMDDVFEIAELLKEKEV